MQFMINPEEVIKCSNNLIAVDVLQYSAAQPRRQQVRNYLIQERRALSIAELCTL